MKRLLAVLVLAGVSAQGEVSLVGQWNIKISPSSDDQKVFLKIQTTGAIPLSSATPYGMGGIVIGYAGMTTQPTSTSAWNMSDTSFLISPIGYTTNSTTGFSRELNHIWFQTMPPEFPEPGANFLILKFSPGEPLFYINAGDIVAIKLFPNPVEFELEIAYSNFNEGVYEWGGSYGKQYIMEIIPEPSSLSLLFASGALLMAGRRRNS